jgi:hypothetical protein
MGYNPTRGVGSSLHNSTIGSALKAYCISGTPGLLWIEQPAIQGGHSDKRLGLGGVPRSIRDVPVGGSRGAGSPVPGASGSASPVLRHLAEGCTNMTRRRRAQPNRSRRRTAGTVTHPGTNRLSGHSEDLFCLYSPSDVVQRSILQLSFQGKWRYICGLGRRPCRREKVIWEMSAYESDRVRTQ